MALRMLAFSSLSQRNMLRTGKMICFMSICIVKEKILKGANAVLETSMYLFTLVYWSLRVEALAREEDVPYVFASLVNKGLL